MLFLLYNNVLLRVHFFVSRCFGKKCLLKHSNSFWIVDIKTSFSILDPPTSYPVISTNVSNFEFDDGAQVTIICELNGGNPLATLVLMCHNLNGADANVGNKTAVSVLSLVVDKYYNNKQCLCLAKHQLFNNSRSKTETITVFCEYFIEIFYR